MPIPRKSLCRSVVCLNALLILTLVTLTSRTKGAVVPAPMAASPTNAFSPVAISAATRPNAYTSAAGDRWPVARTSGAAKETVP